MKRTYVIVIFIIICIFCFFYGRKSRRYTVYERMDTVTVVIKDTVIKEKIIPKVVYRDRVIKDTFYNIDTIKTEVYVPISNYIYEDSLFKAEISGYKVSLDRMEIYQKTTEKTVNIPFPVKNNKRWGLGISVGYALTPRGFQPYIGLGLQYNIINF